MNSVPWQDILNISIVLAISIPILVTVSLPIMIITGQILSILRERSSYAKCAKQIAKLSLALGWILCAAGLGMLWLRMGPTFMAGVLQDGQSITIQLLLSATPSLVHIQADIIVYLSIFAATILSTLVYTMWPSWEEKRILHQCIALVSSFWYALGIYGIICIISAEYAASIGGGYPMSLASLFSPKLESSFWNSAPYFAPLSFALGGGIVSIWLILRRNIDDFGRDYYASMLKWCAAWARAAWFILWFLLVGTTALKWIGTLQQENYLTTPEFMQSFLFLLLWVIPGILWTLTARSATPLRHKATLILAFVLGACIIVPLYLGLVGQ